MTTPLHAVTEFRGTYLSNFWKVPVLYGGLIWRSNEHAYQADKTLDLDKRTWIRAAQSSGEARRRGQQVPLHPDWDRIKVPRMMAINLCKYEQHSDLTNQLVATRGRQLIEANTWNDWFWGAIPYSGQQAYANVPLWNGQQWVGYNWLGRILMMIRAMYE